TLSTPLVDPVRCLQRDKPHPFPRRRVWRRCDSERWWCWGIVTCLIYCLRSTVLPGSISVLPRSGFVSKPRVASTLGDPYGCNQPRRGCVLRERSIRVCGAAGRNPFGVETQNESLPRLDAKARQPWA